MAKRTVMTVVGAALLVVGLAGLGLVQTGVLLPGSQAVKPPGVAEDAGGARQTVADQAPPKPPEALPASSGASPARPLAQSAPVHKKIPKAPVASNANRAHRIAARLKARETSRPLAHSAPAGQASAKSGPNHPRWRAVRVYRNSRPVDRDSFAPTRPVVIKFTFDPARDRPVGVASVHLGDRIRVHVQRIGDVGRRVYFTFSRGLDSRRGAVLRLRTMYSFERPVSFRGGRGYYVIQVRIYPNNRWRIMPRSLV